MSREDERSLVNRSAPPDENAFDSFLRWAPLLAGGALAAYGLSRRSKGGVMLAAAGGAIAYGGTRLGPGKQQDFARTSLLINASPEEVFNYWRKLENLPRFMHHIESVTELDGRRSKWIAFGPANSRVEWTAEIVTETPGRLLAWRSEDGSPVQVDGSVEFRPAPADRGTYLDAIIQYRPPAGKFGSTVAKLLGKNPGFLMEQDMRRFKALMETGEVPTVEGQSHGPRSMVGEVAMKLDPDRKPAAASQNETREQRRIS
jgi:uncharacterized membrane protein